LVIGTASTTATMKSRPDAGVFAGDCAEAQNVQATKVHKKRERF
jgi:hypothetical protein